MSRCSLRGRGLLPPSRPRGGGRSRLHALGRGVRLEERGPLVRFWGGEGDEQTKSLQVPGKDLGPLPPVRDGVGPAAFSGRGMGGLYILKWEGGVLREGTPPRRTSARGAINRRGRYRCWEKEPCLAALSVGEEAAPTAFGAEGRGVCAPWGRVAFGARGLSWLDIGGERGRNDWSHPCSAILGTGERAAARPVREGLRRTPFPSVAGGVRGEQAGNRCGRRRGGSPGTVGRKVENLDIFGLNGRMVDSV